MRLLTYPSLGLLLYCVSIQAFGVETGVTAGLSTEWNDNVYLTHNNRRSDWEQTLRLLTNLDGNETAYQYGVNYNISYRHYEHGSFGANSYYNGRAFLNLNLVPRRLQWYSGIESETTLISSTLPDVPTNRDQRTTYTTTPTLTLIEWPRDNVALSAQATKVDYRESGQSDSNRVSGSLTWTHQVSPLTQLTATGSQQQVNFTTVTDYKSVNYQVGIKRKINGGEVNLSAGKNKITPNVGAEINGSSYTANVNWSSQEHTWLFQAYRDLTDTSLGLSGAFDSTGFISPTEVNTGQTEIVVRTRYSLSYTYSPISTFRVNSNFYWDDEKSQTTIRDTLRKGAAFILSRDFLRDLTASFEFNYEKANTDRFAITQQDIIKRYRFTVKRVFQKSLTVTGWIGRQEDNSNLLSADYEQHVIGVEGTFQY